MKNKTLRYLILFLLIFAHVFSFATGPSYVKIKIRPIALVNQNMILCKTFYEINQEGAQAIVDVRFGLLLISPEGVFFQTETFHYVRDNYGQYGNDSIYEAHEKIFNADKITDEENTFLKEFIYIESIEQGLEKYFITESYSYIDFMNRYKMKDNFTQRTVNNYCSLKWSPEKISIYFKYKNIVMIRNNNDESFFDESKSGSNFNVPSWWGGRSDPYNSQNIDGIVITTNKL